MNPEELARSNALRPTDPLREGEMLLLPKRVAAAPQPAPAAQPDLTVRPLPAPETTTDPAPKQVAAEPVTPA